MTFSSICTIINKFYITKTIFNEKELEKKLMKFLEYNGLNIIRQESVQVGRNDLVIYDGKKKICIELKINSDASVSKQLDKYISYYPDGVILVCWKASKTLKQIFENVKPTIKIPIELIEIKKNQMIV